MQYRDVPESIVVRVATFDSKTKRDKKVLLHPYVGTPRQIIIRCLASCANHVPFDSSRLVGITFSVRGDALVSDSQSFDVAAREANKPPTVRRNSFKSLVREVLVLRFFNTLT